MDTTIDDAGRVMIPLELQTKLGLKPGMKLDVEAAGGAMMLKPAREGENPSEIKATPLPAGSGLVWKDGVLVFMCEFEDPNFDLPAFVEATRNARDYGLTGDAK